MSPPDGGVLQAVSGRGPVRGTCGRMRSRSGWAESIAIPTLTCTTPGHRQVDRPARRDAAGFVFCHSGLARIRIGSRAGTEQESGRNRARTGAAQSAGGTPELVLVRPSTRTTVGPPVVHGRLTSTRCSRARPGGRRTRAPTNVGAQSSWERGQAVRPQGEVVRPTRCPSSSGRRIRPLRSNRSSRSRSRRSRPQSSAGTSSDWLSLTLRYMRPDSPPSGGSRVSRCSLA